MTMSAQYNIAFVILFIAVGVLGFRHMMLPEKRQNAISDKILGGIETISEAIGKIVSAILVLMIVAFVGYLFIWFVLPFFSSFFLLLHLSTTDTLLAIIAFILLMIWLKLM